MQDKYKHIYFSYKTCDCDKTSNSTCFICDGGLAHCQICNQIEVDLKPSCNELINFELLQSQMNVLKFYKAMLNGYLKVLNLDDFQSVVNEFKKIKDQSLDYKSLEIVKYAKSRDYDSYSGVSLDIKYDFDMSYEDKKYLTELFRSLNGKEESEISLKDFILYLLVRLHQEQEKGV